jgi:RimJ/RimL family protein N-acetyltransferase
LRHDFHIAGHAFRLRPVAASDAGYLLELRARGGEFLNRGARTLDEQSAWLGRYFARNGDYCFIVETADGQRREGLVGLYDIDQDAGTAEWGRWVLAPRSNAAVESALLVYRFAFDAVSLASVRCRTLAANAKVVAFHDSCGLARMSAPVTIEHDGVQRAGVEHRLSRHQWPGVSAHLDALAARFAATASRASDRTRR